MTDDDFRAILQAELTPLSERLKIIEIKVSGIPLIAESTIDLRRDMRMVKAAINDMARVNITAGEVEALHEEIDNIQAENAELSTRIATLERLITGDK
jgi:ubiquinone biosynthesis protein UbiJ